MHPVLLHTLAQAEPAAPAPGGSPMNFILMMALFMGAMWFLLIAPQRTRQKTSNACSIRSSWRQDHHIGRHPRPLQQCWRPRVIKVADNTPSSSQVSSQQGAGNGDRDIK
jgi:hypothetical protein